MEYKVEPLKSSPTSIREQLKEYAKEGWELVTIIHQPDIYKKGEFLGYIAYFKKT